MNGGDAGFVSRRASVQAKHGYWRLEVCGPVKFATIVTALSAAGLIGVTTPALAQIDSTRGVVSVIPPDPLAETKGPASAADDSPPVDTAPVGPPRRLGPELWRGARVGMGVADVSKLYPAVQPPTAEPGVTPVVDEATGGALPRVTLTVTPSTTATGTTATGAVAAGSETEKPASGEVRADGSRAALLLHLRFAGAPSVAQFYFKADKLAAVIIDRRDLKAGHAAENMAATQAVIDRLTANYGSPRRCVDLNRISARTCNWTLGETKVVASYRDIGGALPTLSVTYSLAKDEKVWQPGPVRKLRGR